MNIIRTPNRLSLLLLVALAWALPGAHDVQAQSARADDNTEPRSGEYRLTVFPYHKLTEKLTGFGYLGYVTNPDKHYQTNYLGWGVSYLQTPSLQWWIGLVRTYTDNRDSADKLELRPFVGLKNFIANERHWNIYNYARWEYRAIKDQDTSDRNRYSRLRDRFGIEFPFAAGEQAWKLKTWYGLADVEAMYRTDRDQVDPFRLRLGGAYIPSARVRLELIYHVQWTRPTPSSGLEYTDNILRLNIKVALNHGVLQRIFDGGEAVD
jgi:hypothetical protein